MRYSCSLFSANDIVGTAASAGWEDEFPNDIMVLSKEWMEGVLFATAQQPTYLGNSVAGGINQVYTLQSYLHKVRGWC